MPTISPIQKTHIKTPQANVRMELQTLTRLPLTRAILFSFKTILCPISQIKDEGLGPRLADAIEGLRRGNAPGMWSYKAADTWGPPARAYLRSQTPTAKTRSRGSSPS